MNMSEVYGMCHEIYRDLRGKRDYEAVDESILDFILKLYNTTEIGLMEVRALWMEWLNDGNLSIDRQITNARNRRRMFWAAHEYYR